MIKKNDVQMEIQKLEKFAHGKEGLACG